MTDHPDMQLAEYVDGTLGASDRARVEAHVASCRACRDELELASGARQALGALPELVPPDGLTFGVLRESRRRRSRKGVTWKVATAAAAAAVTLAGVFVIVSGPREGADGDAGAPASRRAPRVQTEEEAQEDAAAPSALEATRAGRTDPLFTATDRDYDAEALARLGRRLRDEATTSLESGFREPATAFYEEFRLSDFPPGARAAAGCILEELPPRELAVPFLIQEASFQGNPVYVAAFLQGPAADEPYDRLLLWVLERDGCGLRYYATIRL